MRPTHRPTGPPAHRPTGPPAHKHHPDTIPNDILLKKRRLWHWQLCGIRAAVGVVLTQQVHEIGNQRGAVVLRLDVAELGQHGEAKAIGLASRRATVHVVAKRKHQPQDPMDSLVLAQLRSGKGRRAG